MIDKSKPECCEWNPKENKAARVFDGCPNEAVLSLGSGRWHICEACAKLPQFNSFKKRKLPPVLTETQRTVESYGSVQGVIHSIFMGSKTRHFFIRELATEALIKCVYTSERHSELVKTLKEEGAVVHVYGLVVVNMSHRKIEQITTERIDAAQKLSDDEFEEFVGCCPQLTGEISTQEFIDRIRARND